MGTARRRVDVIRKVLLADDQQAVLELVEATIGNDGSVEIRTAGDGDEALQIARAWRPDLIFLDVMMPKMNGFEVCHTLKTDPGTAEIKVVMLTGLLPAPDGYSALGEGEADGYITKPFKPVELFRVFESMQGQLIPDE